MSKKKRRQLYKMKKIKWKHKNKKKILIILLLLIIKKIKKFTQIIKNYIKFWLT